MEPGAILTSQLPLHAEYPLSSEHDCLDQFSGHYTSAGAFDIRRDGALPSSSHSYSFTPTNEGRLHPESGLAGTANRYKTSNHFTDSSSGSISTSPSSAASSLVPYNSYAQNYTSLPAFPTVSRGYVPSTHAGFPSLSEGVTTATLPPIPSYRPSYASTASASDRDTYVTFNPPLVRNPLVSNGLPSYVDTSRTPFAGSTYLSSSGYQPMASSASPSYTGSPNESSNFPWPNLEVLTDLSCEGQQVTPEVFAKVEKGFFLSTVDQKWTCYRRNYFSVVCSFDLHPHVNNGRLSLKRANASSSSPPELVQAMGMRLSAAVDGSQGKSIELVQHTPKRDNGPKNKIDVVKVSPAATAGRNEHTVSPHGVYQVPLSTFHPTGASQGPYLPLQNSSEGNTSSTANNQSSSLSPSYPYTNGTSHLPNPGQSTSHTFERVQFKQATANNGKRRASQQYFHLMVELFADVRKDGSDTPSWIKVAQRVSEKIVVRGRSPSHYQNEGQNGQAARGGSGGGGNGYHSIGGATYGSLNSGGFRSAIGAFGGSIGGSSGYHRNGHYGYNGSSGDSASSPGSVEGGAADSDQHMDTMMTDADGSNIQDYEGYRYYPSTIYQHVPPQLPVPKVECDLRNATEPRRYGHTYALKTEYSDAIPGPQWQEGGCGRFEGVESSRGYYPTLSVGTPNYS